MNSKEMEFFVYALIDPRSDEIRYIGATGTPEIRLRAHVSDALLGIKNVKREWIKSLIQDGKKPLVKVLFSSTVWSEVLTRERELIFELAHTGRLTNKRITRKPSKSNASSRRPSKTRFISIAVSEELYRRIAASARLEDRSISWFLRKIINAALP